MSTTDNQAKRRYAGAAAQWAVSPTHQPTRTHRAARAGAGHHGLPAGPSASSSSIR